MAESVSVYKKSGTLQVTLNGAQPPWDPWNVPSIVFVMEAESQASRARSAKSGKDGGAEAGTKVRMKFHDLDKSQAAALKKAFKDALKELDRDEKDFNLDVTALL